jgi:hypothetical protein
MAGIITTAIVYNCTDKSHCLAHIKTIFKALFCLFSAWTTPCLPCHLGYQAISPYSIWEGETLFSDPQMKVYPGPDVHRRSL